MDRKFILTCESTVDVPYAHWEERDIPVLFYKYVVNGQEYIDDMDRTPGAREQFYKFIAEGDIPKTSQINQYTYGEFFEEQLKKGQDLMHICLGTGMTLAYNNAVVAAEELKEKYPDRKIVVIDSYCSSSGYGLLVDYAADMADEGKSIEEVEEWINENRFKVHHQFYAVDLQYYKRTGRMSGPTATLAAVLNICPIMRLDRTGHIIAYSKVRGRDKAIKATIDWMEEHAQGGLDYCGKLWISHSERYEDAVETKKQLAERFKKVNPDDIQIYDIGTIIASHCGPGTLAIFFMGDERPEKI